MSNHSTFPFRCHYFWLTSLQTDLCLELWLCGIHIPVCQSCVNQSKGQLKCEWMNGLGLFGFSGTFSLLLYCRIVLDLLYIFLWGRGLGWHLLQYCDDYLKIVNCTEFTLILFVLSVGIPYKICILWFFFFPSQTVENQIVQLQEFILPSAFFSELWLREILKL